MQYALIDALLTIRKWCGETVVTQRHASCHAHVAQRDTARFHMEGESRGWSPGRRAWPAKVELSVLSA